MALQTVTLGDATTLTVPMRTAGAAFTPAAGYQLIFTAKLATSDLDAAAVIQKKSGGFGLTESTSSAVIALLPIDTSPLAGGVTLYCDIQAQSLTDAADIKTVAIFQLLTVRDVTRLTDTSITVYNTQPAAENGLTPITVVDAAARKALTGLTAGWSRVIQADLTGILWILVAADPTLDISWIGLPYTVDPDGDVVINMELANMKGIVPDANVLGQVGGRPTIGNAVKSGGLHIGMTSDLLSLTLIGDASKDVKAYTLEEWAAYGVIDANWKLNATTLNSLHIGQGVTSIGANAFDGCTGIKGNLVIPGSVTAIGNNAFDGNLTATGTLTLNEGLLTIGDAAFDHASFTGDLVIPNSVTTIGDSAFLDTGLNGTLTLGSGLLTLGNDAFGDSEFTGTLNVPGSITHLKMNTFVYGSWSGLILNEGLLTTEDGIGGSSDGAFEDNDFGGSLVIPNSMTRIGRQTFYNAGFTGTLTLGSGLLTIGIRAFRNCNFTGSLTIPGNVTAIEEDAFDGCDGFTSLTLNEGLLTIGESAFEDCTALTSVTIPEGITTIGDSSFEGCSALTSVTIPSTVTTLDGQAFRDCSALTTITCHITQTIFEANSNVLLNSGVTSIIADTGKGWTAGAGQTFGGKTGITVTLV